MRELRQTLSHIVTLVLATSCGGSHHKTPPTGGGCEGMMMPQHAEAPLDDKLRAAIERCTTKPKCAEVCDLMNEHQKHDDCTLDESPDPEKVVVTYMTQASCPGRRPRAASRRSRAIRTAGALLARQAELEALSVPAFEELARALALHGAPRELIVAAERAARDEVRHAATCRRLARRYGGRSVPARAPSAARVPTLVELAIDNVVEGEVRETWGAAVATWQARAAGDPEIRDAMATIARDETAHAELAAQIGTWVRTRLDARSRRRVERARTAAIAELADAVRAEPPAAAVAALGIPDAAAATRLMAELRTQLWSA